MGLKPRFTRQDIEKALHDRMNRINNTILMRLQYLGEECVNHARSLPSDVGFMDQTGNLRSSIGYVVYLNGTPVGANFEQKAAPKGDGAEGKSRGEKLAKEIAEKYPKGFVLVVVAGMNYALYVESKGRDVLTSAQHLAERECPRIIKEIKEQVNRMK